MAATKSGYWFPGCGVEVEEIDLSLFTHLHYGFAIIDPSSLIATIPVVDMTHFATFSDKVSTKDPSVKTILSIGGNRSKVEDFASMANDPEARADFIESAIDLARSYGFHGLDLDWKYPDSPLNMSNFSKLLAEWATAIQADAAKRNLDPLLLTASVYRSAIYNRSVRYPVVPMGNNLDWINVISYDLYTSTESDKVAPPAALHNKSDQRLSVFAGIKTWLQGGMPSHKIVMGLPFFGYKWKLETEDENDLFAPSYKLQGDQSLVYRAIKASTKGFTVKFDPDYVTNYCYKGLTWIGYDDTESIVKKVEYVKETNLLGYFVWHVGGDDNWVLSKEASSTCDN